MTVILNLETSTKNCSVSIAKDGEVISLREINTGGYSHAEMLHPLIVETLKETKLTIKELSAIAVGKGPGSYTGLRIGVSAAKGLCFTHNIPLIAINSLDILSRTCEIEKGLIVPMLDARRMEVYSAIYNHDYQLIRKTKAEIITEQSFLEYLEKTPVYFLGDGAEKCKTEITNRNAFFINDKFPSAKEMALLSFDKYKKNDIEDVAYFEPFYLKDFVATKEKKKL